MKRFPSWRAAQATAPVPGVAAALLAIAAANAGAQVRPDTFALDPIVVTATRLPTPLRALPVAVTVLDGRALRSAGVRFVADALRSVPGLDVARTGSAGGVTALFLRGSESDHVQVLVDGVPVNDPGGALDLAHLGTADVERIEIVRGPASVLYGTDAAAGVIQIFTRRGGGPAHAELMVQGSRSNRVGPAASGGSSGFDATASVTGGGRRTAWALSAARLRSDGAYAFNNEYRNTALTGRLRLQPAERTALSLSLRHGDGRFHFPTDGGGALADRNQFRDSETLSAGIELEQALGSRVELSASLASHSADHLLDDAPDGPADTLGFFAARIRDRLRRQRADVHANIRNGPSILTVGAAAERQRSQSELLSLSAFGPFEDESRNERTSSAAYVQLVTALRPGLALTGGTRLERSSRFGSLVTGRAGLNLRGAAGTIRLAAGTGFKEPTFYENFATGFVRGNPDLEPERTRSVELGAERDFADGRIRIEATAFAQRMRNLIQYTPEPPAAGAANYFNVGAARASGLEVSARLNAAGGLGVDVAYTLLRTRVTDAGFGTDRAFLQDLPLLRRPRHHANITVDWASAAGRLRTTVAIVGRREDLDFGDPADFAGSRVTLPAWARVDAGFERTLLRRIDGPQLDLLVRVENLLDRRYEEVRGFPAPGRLVAAGVRIGF